MATFTLKETVTVCLGGDI